MLDEWSRLPLTNRETTIDIFAEMMRVTLHIAVQTLLGVGPSPELQRVSVAVSEVLERTNDIITNPVSLPTWLPTPKNRRFVREIGILDRFVYDTIAKRRAEGGTGGDLLSMLLSARDEQTGQGMSDRQLRDEAVTILIAGHETTANALSWAIYLLGKHPEYQQRLHAELDRVLSGRWPAAEDLANLPFTRAVIDESMRLYPPAWMIGRLAIRDDVIGPYLVRAGEFAMISPYMTHRNPKLWDSPDAFDPDRFLDGRAERLPKFSYLPFGGGQRFCIGANFATLQSVLMLASIFQRFSMRVDETHPVVPYAMITLRPKHGIRMHVTPRR
jgi:cytochrome P450